MSLPLLSQSQLYQLGQNVIQSKCPQLTDFLPGAILDGICGFFSVAGMELQRYNVLQFNKTFIDLASGPEITGGPDDLQTLAVDHYGEAFERPGAIAAIDTVTFSRANATAGAITILSGTVLATQPDANGNVQTYTTNSTVILTASGANSLSISVAITAVVAGAAGDAVAGAINVIQTSLTDSTIRVTNTGNATGEDAQNDATYRETIRDLLISLRAATQAAIEAAANAVPGVVVANAIMIEQSVIFWDTATNEPIGQYFLIPFATLYIADNTGGASSALLAAVIAAITPIQAYGVQIAVVGATTVVIDWDLNVTLNPSGPNYGTLSGNTAAIQQSMSNYIATLPAATDFVRQVAEEAILAIWGPAGSNDIVPIYTFVVTSANATLGAIYSNNGFQYTVKGTIAGATSLVGAGTGVPAVSGILTKVSGTGDASITFSSAETTMTVIPAGDVSVSATQKAVPGTVSTV